MINGRWGDEILISPLHLFAPLGVVCSFLLRRFAFHQLLCRRFSSSPGWFCWFCSSVLQVCSADFSWWMGSFCEPSRCRRAGGFIGGGSLFDGALLLSSSGDCCLLCLIFLCLSFLWIVAVCLEQGSLGYCCGFGVRFCRILFMAFCSVVLCLVFFVGSELCWWLQIWRWFGNRKGGLDVIALDSRYGFKSVF